MSVISLLFAIASLLAQIPLYVWAFRKRELIVSTPSVAEQVAHAEAVIKSLHAAELELQRHAEEHAGVALVLTQYRAQAAHARAVLDLLSRGVTRG